MWAAGVALRVRSIQGGPLMQIPVFLILFLAPVYVPLDLLSGWIHAVASVNPVTALLEAGRGFISGDPSVIGLAFAIGDRPPAPLRALVARRPAQRRSRGLSRPATVVGRAMGVVQTLKSERSERVRGHPHPRPTTAERSRRLSDECHAAG